MGRKKLIKVKKEKKIKVLKSKLICSMCEGKININKKQMEKLVGLFGTEQDVREKYVCRVCRKTHNLRKDGRPKPEKRTRKKSVIERDHKGEVILPSWMTSSGPNDCGWKTFKCPDGYDEAKFQKILGKAARKIFCTKT